MSLARFIAAMDEPALLAAGSKGLLVRAKKDVEAGRVGGAGPELDVAGETVTLSDKSLEAARCTCPATGVCRHIIAAVLFLRGGDAPRSEAGAPAPEEAAPAASAPPPAFPMDEIESFAGAEWPRAVAHAETGHSDDGPGTVTVQFEETGESVAFARGQPLRQAIYKGPRDSRRRMAVAAAALVLAAARGEDLPETAARAGPSADPETLKQARAAIEAAAVALSAGTLDAARDRLFAAAISARAEAIPRLAAEMRGASRRMDPAALRRAEETPVSLLAALARTHALTLALDAAPDDPALCGVLARSFAPSGRRELAMLGAEWWETPAGAKGFTAVFADLDSGAMHRAVHARAAGTDLGFNPQSGWRLPLWSLAPPQKIGAERIVLPDAALAPDGGLGLNQRAEWADARASLDDLEQAGAATRSLEALIARIEGQIGLGLRARPGEGYAVFRPAKVHPPSYDPFAQQTVWGWEDEAGQVLELNLPGNGEWSDLLAPLVREIRGGLVALRPGRPRGRLISVWTGQAGPLSLQFERLPKVGKMSGMLDRFRGRVEQAIGKPQAAPTGPMDPLQLLVERALEGTLAGLTGAAGLPDPIQSDLRTLGLSVIEGLDRDWREGGGTAAGALRLAYGLAALQDRLGPD